MAVQTYQPAPNETLGEFVNLLFQRLFFTPNDLPLVLSTFENDVAADAAFEVNGNSFPTAGYLEAIKKFHATSIGKLTKIDDLAVSHFDAVARTGVVAQVTKFAVTSKADGSVEEQVAVTIVKVDEKDGKRILTSLVEAQA
ncbi:hypothetical protein B0H11DRAFT_2189359 [Mycena galericulata]|nr:hypothetical protein B0H11DRAFT_2189359 [Mycena galericulata]